MTFTDAFAGTENQNIEDRSGWTRIDGGAGAAKINASNELKTTTSTNSAYTCTDQGSANHYTQYVVGENSTSVGTFVCIRLTDKDNFIGVRAYSSQWQVYKRDTGSFTNIGTNGGTPTTGDTGYIEGDSNNITVKENGSIVIGPFSETFNNTETAQGFVVRDIFDPFMDDFEAGALAAAGNIITADQAEAGDAISASIVSPRNIASNQTEGGDTTAAALQTLVQINASQTEGGDTQAAAIVGVITTTLTASQTEEGDAQSAAIDIVVTVAASQAEAGDTTAATIDNIVQIGANQAEVGDIQTAAITTQITATITANQVEVGDTQAASVVNLVQLLANQNEAGDTQAAGLSVLVQVAANQTETGDVQVAAILSGTIILEPGRIFTASLPLRTFKAALPIRTYKAAA